MFAVGGFSFASCLNFNAKQDIIGTSNKTNNNLNNHACNCKNRAGRRSIVGGKGLFMFLCSKILTIDFKIK